MTEVSTALVDLLLGELLADTSPLAISILDTELRFVHVNAAAAAINGLAPEAHVGVSWEDVVPDVARSAGPRLREAMRSRRAIVGDEVCGSTPAQPGRMRWWRVDWLPLWRDGAAVGIAALFLEITSDKERAGLLERAEERSRLIAVHARAAELEAAERERRAHVRLEALHAVTDAALASLGAEDLLGRVLPTMRRALAAEEAFLLLTTDAGAPTVRYRSRSGEDAIASPTRAAEGIEALVIRGRFPVTARTADDPARAGVPLVAGGRLIGVLSVRHAPGHGYADDDLRLLAAAAGRVALALDRWRIFDQQRLIAETLQRSLLPGRLPDVPGVRLAARYEAGEQGLEVGGDWYDATVLPDGRLALAMGDVMGHGLRAAATMGRLRSELRAHLDSGDDPGQALRALNRGVEQLGGDQLATACVVVLDPATGEVRAANAGHPAPLHASAGGVGALWTPTGPPLGVLPSPGYGVATTSVHEGDALLLYTDGLVEHRDRPLPASTRGLEELLAAALREGREAEVLDEAFAGREGTDDAAALLVRIT